MTETSSDILSGYRLDSATYTGSYGSCSGETGYTITVIKASGY